MNWGCRAAARPSGSNDTRDAQDLLDPSQIISIKNFEVYSYWQKACNGRKMPARADLDPADLGHVLPHILLHEVKRDPLDFRYRLIGSEVLRHFQRNYTGEWMSDIPHQRAPSELWSLLQSVVESGEPALASPPYAGPYKDFKSIETVVLPLAIDGKAVNMLFICIDFLKKQPPSPKDLI